MKYVLIALCVSFAATVVVVRIYFGRRISHATAREDILIADLRRPSMRGIRRIGGLGIALGLLVSFMLRLFDEAPYAAGSARLGLLMLLSAFPVFLTGLIEDFTQRVTKMARLAAALSAALFAGWLLGAWVVRIEVPVLQGWLAIPAVSVVITCLLVAGITNAFNIIDGFNGLAGGVATLILSGIAYVAFKVGDVVVMASALTAVGAIIGFMVLNFPRGLVYLGDGGAYLLGFWIAVLLILLIGRNYEVSPWFAVLLCAYPVCELLFSIYRRGIVRRSHPALPDLAHLHHLVYKRLVRWLVGTGTPAHRTQRNSLTAPYLWIVTSIGVAPAVVLWSSTPALQVGSALFATAYVYAYARIVKFRAPRWWVLRKAQERRPARGPD